MDITVHYEWDPPVGGGPEAIVDYYNVTITPTPLSNLTSNLVYSTSWNVTLKYNVQYTTSTTSLNCAGESFPIVHTFLFCM